jgi:RNA polymerase sporulation-specific sigma factor
MWEEPSEALLKSCKDGDGRALEVLLVFVTPMVRRIAVKLAGRRNPHFDDLLQEGLISILGALPKYDSGRGKFTSFAFSCARNGMVSFLRKEKARRYVHGVLDRADEDPSIAWPTPALDEGLLEGLTVMEAAVLDAFLHTGSVSASAGLLGWPRKKADNALQRARRKLRVNLEGNRPDE